MVEVFRFLGKQEDGGDIYLGKTLMKDAYRDDQQAATIAYSGKSTVSGAMKKISKFFFHQQKFLVLINYDQSANLQVAGLPIINLPSVSSIYLPLLVTINCHHLHELFSDARI